MTITSIITYIFLSDDVSSIKQAGASAVFCCIEDFFSLEGFNSAEFNMLISECYKNDLPVYVSTPAESSEIDLITQKNIIRSISSLNIEGYIIEDYGLLSTMAEDSFSESKKIVLGSNLNIHNVETVNLLNKYNPSAFLINEEILLKNVSRIKKLSKQTLWIDINHSSPLIKFVYRWGIDFVRINSTRKFNKEAIIATQNLNKVLIDAKQGKTAKVEDLVKISNILESITYSSSYKINHFSRMVTNPDGNLFNLNDNVKKADWHNFVSDFIFPKRKLDLKEFNINIRLRLSKVSQVELLKQFQHDHNVNLINIIEFGDIISSSDITKSEFTNIIKYIKNVCSDIQMELYLTTPKILIERDFERLVNAASKLCLDKPQPNALIVNNPGLFKILSQNRKLINFNIEAGEGININNSETFAYFSNIFSINGAFFTLKNLLNSNNYVKDLELNKKSALLLGISKVSSYGMCPINTDMPYSSSLDCNAACQHGSFSLFDPYKNEDFPMILDGFCRPHLISNKIQNNFNLINVFVNAGITDLIIDCRGLPDNTTKNILEIFLNSIKCNIKI